MDGRPIFEDIVQRFGELLVLKQGNTWGNQGTFMTNGAEEIYQQAKTIFEQTSAAHVYVQQRLKNIVFEIRSVRAFCMKDKRMLSTLVVMSPEDGRGNNDYTGPETITRARAKELHALGHTDAYEAMENEVENMAKLVDGFCVEFCGSMPTDYRVDFLVTKEEVDDGNPVFMPYLCEMTEQNASLCGTNPMARFNAMLNSTGMLSPRPIEFSW